MFFKTRVFQKYTCFFQNTCFSKLSYKEHWRQEILSFVKMSSLHGKEADKSPTENDAAIKDSLTTVAGAQDAAIKDSLTTIAGAQDTAIKDSLTIVAGAQDAVGYAGQRIGNYVRDSNGNWWTSYIDENGYIHITNIWDPFDE